jgi:hypothetical protein
MMRHLVAHAPGNRFAAAEFTKVGRVGRNNAVIRVHHNPRLGQTIEEGKQFAEKMRRHVITVIFAKIGCQYWHNTQASTS